MGTSKGEMVALRCAVHAAPTAFRFEWEFHGAGDSVDMIPDGKTVSQGDLSRFFYTPNGDSEFGTFLCWASNEIGRQVQPCVFHVVAAGMYFSCFLSFSVSSLFSPSNTYFFSRHFHYYEKLFPQTWTSLFGKAFFAVEKYKLMCISSAVKSVSRE